MAKETANATNRLFANCGGYCPKCYALPMSREQWGSVYDSLSSDEMRKKFARMEAILVWCEQKQQLMVYEIT